MNRKLIPFTAEQFWWLLYGANLLTLEMAKIQNLETVATIAYGVLVAGLVVIPCYYGITIAEKYFKFQSDKIVQNKFVRLFMKAKEPTYP